MKSDLQFIPAANISEDTLAENQHAHDLCEISKKESFDEKIQKIKTLVPFSERKNTGQKGNGVGIDLGTTYCCAAIVRNGKVEIIPNERGNPITPSFVGFMNDEVFIGDSAKARITQNPQNTLFDAKSMIGRTSEQLKTSKLINHWPFDLIDFNGEPFYKVLIRGEISVLSSTEVSAMLLRKMKMIAEDYLEEEVTDAVITVPAPFNIQQKHATVEAGRMAGFNVLRILNEPTAAAFASVENVNKNKEERRVLVFDLGGGSLDVAVITIEEDIYEIMATAGNLELGGENFDNRLVQHFIKEIEEKCKVDVNGDQKLVRRLKKEVEQVKHSLSESMRTSLTVENINGDVDFTTSIERQTFERVCSTLFEKIIKPVEKALRAARMTREVIDEVILIGGSTRIPKVQSILQDFFNGKKLNKSLHPLQAVATGAAVQASILSGDNTIAPDALLFDVLGTSIGIEVEGGKMYKVIKKNTSIPTKQSITMTTLAENQGAATIQIYEGESELTRENNLIVRIDLTDIPSGFPNIEITIDVDANSDIYVKEKSVGCIKLTDFRDTLDQGAIKLADFCDTGLQNVVEKDKTVYPIKLK